MTLQLVSHANLMDVILGPDGDTFGEGPWVRKPLTSREGSAATVDSGVA